MVKPARGSPVERWSTRPGRCSSNAATWRPPSRQSASTPTCRSATVYRLFSSKLGILKALLDTSIAGDDQPLAVQERPDVASLFAEPDPHKLLAGFAGITTAINQRTNDVYRVLASAAGSDPAAAELLGEIRQQRDRGQGQIAALACTRPRAQARTARTRRRRPDPRVDVPRGLSPSRRRPRLDARALQTVARDDSHSAADLNRRGAQMPDPSVSDQRALEVAVFGCLKRAPRGRAAPRTRDAPARDQRSHQR